MNRRSLVAGVAAAAVVLLAVVAASSGPVRLWTTPPSATQIRSIEPVTSSTTVNDTVPADSEVQPWGGSLLPYLAALLAIAVGLLVVRAVGRFELPGRRRRATRRHRSIRSLPEFDDVELQVDAAAADAALAAGSPRNAIVACWMQLESDAAAAGFERSAAETSVEYVERVVAVSSLDPGPIGELAALFREARFSRHEMTEVDRQRARAALQRVAAALRISEGVAV